MPKNVVSTEIEISKKYTALERKAIARDVVDYLVKRTKQGHGEGNKPWSGKAGEYSESYRESLAFRQKRDKGKVNLTLSSDMLTALNVLKQTPGKIAIGLKMSDPEWGRAKGNILGTYGQNKPIPGKQRPFLNLTKTEIRAILSQYPLKDKETREDAVRASQEAADIAGVD